MTPIEQINQHVAAAQSHLAKIGNVHSPGIDADRELYAAVRLLADEVAKLNEDFMPPKPLNRPVGQKQANFAAPILFSEDAVIRPQSTTSTATAEPDGTDWELALEQCEQIQEKCEVIPDRGSDFAASVSEKTQAIANHIEEFQRVTERQQKALNNMEIGLDRWLDRDY